MRAMMPARAGRRQFRRSMKTLADWLAHAERLHPKNIELGLDRVRAVAAAARPGLRLPRDHGGRHQRQGLDLRDARVDPHARRLPHRRVHLAAPGALRGAAAPRRARRSTATRWRRTSRRWSAARGEVALTYFEFTTLAILLCMAAQQAGRRDPRGGPGRPARRGQHHRRRLRRHHQHRPRPHGLPGPGPREHRLREGRHHARRPPGDRQRPGAAAERGRPRARPSAPTSGASAATSTSRATSSNGAGAGAAGATAGWPIRRCAAPTS